MTTKREPSAAVIKMSNFMREWFEALLQSGFTEAQAIALIGTALGNMTATGTIEPSPPEKT